MCRYRGTSRRKLILSSSLYSQMAPSRRPWPCHHHINTTVQLFLMTMHGHGHLVEIIGGDGFAHDSHVAAELVTSQHQVLGEAEVHLGLAGHHLAEDDLRRTQLQGCRVM